MYFDNVLAPRVTQAFPNINLFPPPNASEGSEKVSTPFVSQMRKLRSKRVMHPAKVTLQANVLFNPLLPDTDTPETHMGKFVQDVFHPDLELPTNVIRVTFLYISSNAFNKQEYIAS